MLEGIGLIEKCVKNKIRWKGSLKINESGGEEKEIEDLTKSLQQIEKEDLWLDEMIKDCKDQLRGMASDNLYNDFAYVTYNDIKELNSQKENKSNTLLAIRAPKGTTLEIPEV